MSQPEGSQGILTEEEITLLKRVQRSKVWRLMTDALCRERELLFAGSSSIQGLSEAITEDRQLWMNRGAILLIQHLLQNGPLFVIWYRRYMEDQEAQRDAAKIREVQDAPAEREYTPGEGTEALREPPDFDL